MTRLARSAPLWLLAALPAALAALPAPAQTDDLPKPPKPGTIVTAGQEKPQLAAARQLSQNNLKQIALGFHATHDTYGAFPGGIYDKTGKVGLSWRVAILPFVDQVALYKEFKLDEPWNSENNKKLIAKMPKLYAPPKGAEVANGLTYYRAFSGAGTILPPPPAGAGKAGQMAPGVKIVAITDGTSNTVMAAEAAEPVIWTKPDELEYDPKKPLPKFGGIFEGGFNVAMCDGSVRFLPSKIDEKVMRALITINGGEVIQIP